MEKSAVNVAFLFLAAAAAVLALDPFGAYFGLRTTWQYAALVVVVTGAAFVGILSRPRASRVLILLAGVAVMAVAMSRTGWAIDGLSSSGVRIALIPYVVSCAYVASEICVSARLFRSIAVIAGVAVAASLLAWWRWGYLGELFQLYHEEVFFVGPLLILSLQSKRRILGAAGVALGLAALLVSNKFTAYAVLFVAFAASVIIFARSRFWRKSKNALWTVVVALSSVASVAAATVYLATSAQAPTGSVDVRSYTYGVRWGQFLEEPVFGGAGASGSEIFVMQKMFVVPSHSDFLDVLAYCGIFGFLVFGAPLFHVIRRGLELIQLDLLVLLVSMVVVSAVNPLLYQPPFLAFLASSIFFLRGVRDERS